MPKPDYQSLLHEYVRICNAALDANQGCYPYNRIAIEIEDRLKSHPLRSVAYDRDEHQPEALFELTSENKRIALKIGHDRPHPRRPWRVSRHYLEEVAAHDDTYITNPAQLDWTWLNDHTLG